MENTEEFKKNISRLEERIKLLEGKINKPMLDDLKKKDFLPSYDILKVFKLLANLPVYTVARTGTPDNGEVWLSDIGGTRKFNARISGVTYSATIT